MATTALKEKIELTPEGRGLTIEAVWSRKRCGVSNVVHVVQAQAFR